MSIMINTNSNRFNKWYYHAHYLKFLEYLHLLSNGSCPSLKKIGTYQPPPTNANINRVIAKPIAKASHGFINLSPSL